MIKNWSVENFKSISDRVSLKMEPLTIFAGANSSGKSTIIQSILLTAQTIQNPVASKSVVLNGHIARFGTFNDIVSNSEPTKDISIAFTLDSDSQFSENVYLSHTFTHAFSEIVSEVDCQFSFSCKGTEMEQDALQLQPKLEMVSFNVNKDHETPGDTKDILITRSEEQLGTKVNKLELIGAKIGAVESKSMEFNVSSTSNFNSYKRSFRIPIKGKICGATMSHFLPQGISMAYDVVDEHARNFIDNLLNGSVGSYYYRYFERTTKYEINEDLFYTDQFKKLLFEIVESFANDDEVFLRHVTMGKHSKDKLEKNITKLKQNFNTENLFSLFNIPSLFKRILLQRLTEKTRDLSKAATATAIPNHTVELFPLPELIGYGVEVTRATFNSNLKYLGPLRDEPKSIYPLSTNVDSANVGFKGEYTAAVLDTHRNTIVEYIPTASLEMSNPIKAKVPLMEAVLDWLAYMGIAKNVTTEDKGKLGHELKVSISDGKLHELTHVGVGVSQVLPILVLSLMGKRQSVLVFEQPELHLHPRVQTRLADFFISMTQLGKQCIVETHSEYFINRLRYNVAVGQGSKLAEDVIMYFVEKKNNQSNYRPVRINKYGVIEDWPEGFFDEAEDISSNILRAAMEKRSKEKK